MSNKSPNITDLLSNKNAVLADKVLDYYDGEQEEWFKKLLSDPNQGRKEWQQKGLIPRTRNILKMVVDKSGLLFNDKAPVLNVTNGQANSIPDNQASTVLQSYLEKVDWVEFFTNFDAVVRMLKTACILIQYDTEADTLVFDILTQQNCAVVQNPNNKMVNTLVYRTNDPDDEIGMFRVYTKDLIQDITVDENGDETITATMPNPFGIIPIVAFHDTNIPRIDFWNKIPTDLVNINDLYNFHITDSEYAASWAKLQTLFTNAKIESQDDMQFQSMEVYGSPLPRYAPAQSSLMGGPGAIVQINTNGVDSPFVEYKGPVVDLMPIDDMVSKWVADYAQDWSVNINLNNAGTGTADSGFKLVVEELPNLELRKKRQRMMEAGFRRLYPILAKIVNYYHPGTFDETLKLEAVFSDPVLPVSDPNLEEQAWSMRIMNGRASRVDYFMQVYGMSKQEAMAKILEVDSENKTAPAPATVKQFSMALSNPNQTSVSTSPVMPFKGAPANDPQKPDQPVQSVDPKQMTPASSQSLGQF